MWIQSSQSSHWMALWLLATVRLHIPHGHFDGPELISISPDRSSIVQMHGCILSTTSINDIDISNPYSSLTEELSNDENDNVFESTINTTSSEFDEEPPKLQNTHKSIKLMVVHGNSLVIHRTNCFFLLPGERYRLLRASGFLSLRYISYSSVGKTSSTV
jgi:phage replication-related protein YjqB (UPF0714/DUF867 family)